MWENYVGSKIIRATPMDENSFHRIVKGEIVPEAKETREGYLVTYPQMGNEQPYQSWSPKEVFENAYRTMTKGEIRIVQED